MAGKAGEAFIEVVPKLTEFGAKLGSDVDKQTRSASSRIGASMTKLGAGMTAGLTVPIVAGFAKSFQAFSESATVQAQTQAALKSTGEAANVTGKQVADLANEISKYGAVDDEAVQAAENLLLTFTAVRNEAGKGHDIFTQTTKAAADMAARGFGDLSSNAVLLGKTLQDPTKGFARLARVGMDSVSESTKKTVIRLAEAGKTAEAQRIILSAVFKQVGGSAEAFGDSAAGGAAKAQISIENAMENIGTAIAPVVQQLAKIISTFTGWLSGLSGPARTAIVVIAGVAAAMGPLLIIVGQIITLAPKIKIAATVIGRAATTAFGPWGIAIAAAIAAVYLIVKNWGLIKRVAIRVWNAVRDAVVTAWRWIVSASKVGVRILLAVMTGGMSEVVRFVISHWSQIREGIAKAWRAVLDFLRGVPGKIIGFFADAGKWLFDAGAAIITGLWDGIKSVWNKLTGWIGSVGGWLKKLKGPAAKDARLLVPEGRAIMGGLERGLREGWRDVAGFMGGIAPALSLRLGTHGARSFQGAGRAIAIAGALTLTPDSEAYVRGILTEADRANARHVRTMARMRGRR